MATNLRGSEQVDGPNKCHKSDSPNDNNSGNASDNEENYQYESFEDDNNIEGRSCDGDGDSLSSSPGRWRDSQDIMMFTNKTFSRTQIREIERQNSILMNKILTYSRKPPRPKSTTLPKYHTASASINRKRFQQKVDRENQILLRKIQSVKSSMSYHKM